jgi:hypothetical protein
MGLKGFWMTQEDNVRRVLAPIREAKLYRAFKQAWDDVRADRARYPIWPRTRANMVFERLAIRLQEQFSDDPNVRFEFAAETVKITFDDDIVARVKKADNRGLGHNVETIANSLFTDQTQYVLEGFEPLDKIEIVYVLNMYSTEIERVVVQARDGDVRLWAYEIEDAIPLAPTAPISPLPTPPAPPADADDLVRPRTTPISKDETDKGK